mmetsp:Transcript_27523/g.82452  ORF Transcript_27523/g.82452 Transcript_27523/m.82452 type:complete len:103 (+) Transcript_27523:850-1158(+)
MPAQSESVQCTPISSPMTDPVSMLVVGIVLLKIVRHRLYDLNPSTSGSLWSESRMITILFPTVLFNGSYAATMQRETVDVNWCSQDDYPVTTHMHICTKAPL